MLWGCNIQFGGVTFYAYFEYPNGSAISDRNSELPTGSGISILHHNYLLQTATANPMQNLNSTQNFGSSTCTSAYVGNVRWS